MPLPKEMVDEYLKKAENVTFFGIKIKDLTKDELIVAAVMGWEVESRTREQLNSRMKL